MGIVGRYYILMYTFGMLQRSVIGSGWRKELLDRPFDIPKWERATRGHATYLASSISGFTYRILRSHSSLVFDLHGPVDTNITKCVDVQITKHDSIRKGEGKGSH